MNQLVDSFEVEVWNMYSHKKWKMFRNFTEETSNLRCYFDVTQSRNLAGRLAVRLPLGIQGDVTTKLPKDFIWS